MALAERILAVALQQGDNSYLHKAMTKRLVLADADDENEF